MQLKTPSNDRSPIFIVGVHRSGTTLLRYMLSSHPRIYIPPESDFIPRFFQERPHQPLREDQAVRILKLIFDSYRFSKEWRGEHPDPQHFIDKLSDLKPSTFLDALYKEYASQYGAQRWGDKTPIYTSYMDLIGEIFPEAKFIHVIRDGRDVVLSMVETWGGKEFHVDPYFAAASWVKRIQQAFSSAQSLGPDQYIEVLYENLVSDPESVLKQICLLLGETYYPSMSRPQILGEQRIPPNTFHARIRQPPSANRIGRWRHDLPQKDLKLVQKVAGETLSRLGYQLEDNEPMQIDEIVRFAALKGKYHILQFGRNILQYAGIFHPN